MTKPFPYQKDAILAAENDYDLRCLLALDPGLGKTLISLLVYKRNPKCRPCVVVCPANLKWNWEREAAHHIGVTAEVLEGKTIKIAGIAAKPKLLIINYDILWWWVPYLTSLKPGMVVIDECQYLQNKSAKRTKAADELCKKVPAILALSGTPLLNRPRDLWPTLHILKPKVYKAFGSFGHKYCGAKRVPWGPGWDYSGSSNLLELNKELRKEVMFRLRKADVLHQLPPKIRTILPVHMDKADRKEYEQLLTDFKAWMAKRNPLKLRKAERAQRLTQLGYMKRFCGRAKMKFVFEWIDSFLANSEGKLLIFGIHKSIIAALEERYVKTAVVVSGKTPKRDRKLLVDRFQKNPKCRLFIGNIKAAGVGLNLTEAHDVLFVEIGWTPGEHSQAEDRCYGRVNDLHGANVTFLITANTIESKLIKLIHKKQRDINAVMDGKTTKNFDLFNQLTLQLIGDAA